MNRIQEMKYRVSLFRIRWNYNQEMMCLIKHLQDFQEYHYSGEVQRTIIKFKKLLHVFK